MKDRIKRLTERSRTLKEIRVEVALEDTRPGNPILYEMLPSALNNPKFLSEVGPGFKFSLNNANTYAFTAILGL